MKTASEHISETLERLRKAGHSISDDDNIFDMPCDCGDIECDAYLSIYNFARKNQKDEDPPLVAFIMANGRGAGVFIADEQACQWIAESITGDDIEDDEEEEEDDVEEEEEETTDATLVDRVM